MDTSHRALIAIPVCILLPLAGLSAILLRIYVQRQLRNRLHAETYILSVAWLLTSALAGSTAHQATAGTLGRPGIPILERLRIEAAFRLAHQLLTATSIQLVRVALLLMYRRLFATPSFRRRTDAVLGTSLLYYATVVAGFSLLYALYPVDDGSGPVDTRAYFVANAAISTALDVLTLCLPVTAIRKLRLSARRRVGLAATFGLGAVCVGASVARLACFVDFLELRDMRRAAEIIFRTNMLAVVEPCVSIVAACLPMCAAMLRENGRQRIPRSGSEGNELKRTTRVEGRTVNSLQ